MEYIYNTSNHGGGVVSYTRRSHAAPSSVLPAQCCQVLSLAPLGARGWSSHFTGPAEPDGISFPVLATPSWTAHCNARACPMTCCSSIYYVLAPFRLMTPWRWRTPFPRHPHLNPPNSTLADQGRTTATRVLQKHAMTT